MFTEESMNEISRDVYTYDEELHWIYINLVDNFLFHFYYLCRHKNGGFLWELVIGVTNEFK
ncbi:hypothetical protein WOSG25_050820 [Weissella oryzae SG25]|uniref:Uncharacterized protein n=1 Tax=Weissella oryzae (strain DSM 25784 / JCM 18191 / LMG 30913 / SG25) TaxID=1329250 RepID=A0A069CSP1_WEIOS|nr:hypothetical protein [Weissella oryzae]GAK30810.1 hypothetical protein WOSG25_050820 [Weissella oryzae SG25]